MYFFTRFHSGPKIKKSPGQKTHYIKFTKNFFDQTPILCNFKNGQNSIFELGKSLKLPEMQLHGKKIDLFVFMSFFAGTFVNFQFQILWHSQYI